MLTGIETVLADDPGLDVRLGEFEKKPLVVVADSRARLPATARLLTTGAPVLQACVEDQALAPDGCERAVLPSAPDGRVALDALLGLLAERGINELHVEAGPVLTGALLTQGLVDELLVYQAPCIIGIDGGAMLRLPAVEKLDQRLQFTVLERRVVGPDIRLRLAPAGGR